MSSVCACYIAQTMYTIRQASLRSGVSIPLLRAWERRYQVVTPSRTAAGYRLYDDAAVATFRRMRELVDAGWSPAQAGAALRSGEEAARVREVSPIPPSAEAAPGTTAPTSRAIVDAARRLDVAALERDLDDALLLADLERALESVVLPALVAIGAEWQAGTLDVASEHLASAAVLRRLALAFQSARQVRDAPLLLVGLPPGSRHTIGAFAFAVAARRAGLGVVYLGADTPRASWQHAAAELRPAAVVLGVTMDDDAAPALDLVRGLMPLRVYAGGASAELLADAGVTVLDGLGASVDRVRRDLAIV